MGRGSLRTEKFWKGPEAENDGVRISAAVRWLSQTEDVKTRPMVQERCNMHYSNAL